MIPARPLVNLRLDIQFCQYDVYVNGGLVTRNGQGNPAHEDQPINHWLRSGSNQIDVLIYLDPVEPDTCEIKVAVVIKDADNEQAAGVTALVLGRSAKAGARDPVAGSTPPGLFDSARNFKPADKGDLRVGPARLIHLESHPPDPLDMLTRTFEIHLPFPEWAFFKGEKMKQAWEFKDRDEGKPSYREILAAYVKIWTLLEKHDVNAFVDACDERSREMDLAYYKKAGETRRRLHEELESALNDSSLMLEPATPAPGKYWTYSVGSRGNLIALMAGPYGSSILQFVSKDGTPYVLTFPVVFRKESGRYIVTR